MRRVAPIQPAGVNANLITPTKSDFSIFADTGDALIKSARQGFELSVETSWKTQAADAYNQFGNDPIKLTAALAKIQENIIPDEMPEDLKDKMQAQMLIENASLVSKANNNYLKLQDQALKNRALENYKLDTTNAERSYFNYLIYQNTPADKRLETDRLAVYNALGSMAANADIIDHDGNYIFSDSQREEMKFANKVKSNAFKEYVYSLPEEQLKKFDSEVFQNQEKFKADNGLDFSTYQSWSDVIGKRWKELKISGDRQIQVQATYNAAHLLDEPTTDMANKIKESKVFDNDVVDNVLKQSKKSIEEFSYDPRKPTSPVAYIKAMAVLSDILSNDDFSAQGREEVLKAGANAMIELGQLQRDENIDPETYEKIKKTLTNAITNKGFIDSIQEIEPKTFMQKLQPWKYGYGQTNIEKVLSNTVYRQGLQELNNFVLETMSDYANGMVETGRANSQKALEKAAQLKAQLTLGVSPMKFKELQNQLANKIPAIYNYKGGNYRFLGINDGTPMFELDI